MSADRAAKDGFSKEERHLDEAIREWMARAPAGFVRHGKTLADCYGLDARDFESLQREFDALALDLFSYQYERIPTYRTYARSLDRTPSRARRARDVPALPVEAFKHRRIATFPASRECLQFHTSGTTGSASGVVGLQSAALYEDSLERAFEHHVLPDVDHIRMLILVPAYEEMTYSSLAFMLTHVRRRWGTPESAHYVRNGQLQWPSLKRALQRAAAAGEPVCMLGTSLAWVQFLDACAEEPLALQLPLGTRVFETGGYKGRGRRITQREIAAGFTRLGVPETHLVSEYGMTELASQYYTLSLRAALLGEPLDESTARKAAFSAPAWLRPRLLDSASAAAHEVYDADGIGLLTHHDLANRGSVAHLLTADLGAPAGASFTLEGRCARVEARGCGLAYQSLPRTTNSATHPARRGDATPEVNR